MGHRSNWRVTPHYVKTQFTLQILRKNDKIDCCAFKSEWIFTKLSGDVANDNIFRIKFKKIYVIDQIFEPQAFEMSNL